MAAATHAQTRPWQRLPLLERRDADENLLVPQVIRRVARDAAHDAAPRAAAGEAPLAAVDGHAGVEDAGAQLAQGLVRLATLRANSARAFFRGL